VILKDYADVIEELYSVPVATANISI